jgi:muconate cycloisomerase
LNWFWVIAQANEAKKTIVKIRSIEAILVDIPTTRIHKLSFGSITEQNYVIVKVMDDDGRVGIGEAATIGGPAWAAESTETIQIMIQKYLAPHLIGLKPIELNACGLLMDKLVRGNLFAKAAVEMALLDLASRQLGLPAYALMGGKVHDSLPLAWTLASGETERDIAEGEEKLAQRLHRIFKLKIGYNSVEKDVNHVTKIAEHFAGRAKVQVDVNQAWSEAQAYRAIAQLEAAGTYLIEQPIAKTNIAGMARLAQRFDIPIMADESLATIEDALALTQSVAADIFALKLTKAGGPLATIKTAAIAQAAGIGCYGGCMLESSVGTAAYLSTFSTISGLTEGCELFGPKLLKDDLVTEPLEFKDFCIVVNSKPGFGVELDPKKLAFYRRDKNLTIALTHGDTHALSRAYASPAAV